jgi:endoglucanase
MNGFKSYWYLAVILCISAGYSQQTFVQQHGQLRVVGTHIVDKNGAPVTLRGMASYHSDAAGKYYTDAVVKWLRDDWFCTVVRAANMTGNYTAEMPKTMALVDAAIKYGLYAIIDWHVVGASNQTNALAFFDVMAKKYANVPNILYETWNEPVDGTWTANLKPYHEAVIAKIRQYDSANIVICGTTYWSKNVDEASRNPITKYKNIAYTLHWYSFQDFQSLRDKTTTAMKNGICVFSTENGVANFNQSPCQSNGSGLNFAEGQIWFKFCNDSGISTATWSVHDKDECTSILKPGTDPSGQGNWATSSLTTSGVWMRNYLRAQNATSVRPQNNLQTNKNGVVFSDCQVNTLRFSYSYPKTAELRFDVYNSAGCKVSSSRIQLSGTGVYSINIAEMCGRGFYMVKLLFDNNQYSKKIVVVR